MQKEGVTKELNTQMFFRTASADQFTGTPAEIPESFLHVHTIGNANNKYFCTPINHAQLANHQSLSYRRDYYKKEALDLAYNHRIHEDMKHRQVAKAPDVDHGIKTH